MAIEFEIQDSNSLEFDISDPQNLEFGTRDIIEVRQSGDYPDLTNKPQINGVILVGNKTTEELLIDVGVTSWNGQTGDVVYTPPEAPVQSVNGKVGAVVLDAEDVGAMPEDAQFTIGYDESVSVGSAVVGEAVTGEPNYTPSGTVTGSVTTSRETFMTGGSTMVNTHYANYKLYFDSVSFVPTTTTKNIVTGVGDFAFNGNGVTFAIEQEN